MTILELCCEQLFTSLELQEKKNNRDKASMIMKNCDESIEINCNPNCPYIANHLYANLSIGVSGSGKSYYTHT